MFALVTYYHGDDSVHDIGIWLEQEDKISVLTEKVRSWVKNRFSTESVWMLIDGSVCNEGKTLQELGISSSSKFLAFEVVGSDEEVEEDETEFMWEMYN